VVVLLADYNKWDHRANRDNNSIQPHNNMSRLGAHRNHYNTQNNSLPAEGTHTLKKETASWLHLHFAFGKTPLLEN
jgi:hypothetical protein